MNCTHTWVVVLAAGDGTRLKALTTDPDGVAVPKQFWSLSGGPSLLELALERARRVVSPERICVVIGARHQAWWNSLQASVANENVFVEPRNRGTAIGVLLAVLTIVARDARARVVFLPADHYVAQEAVLAGALRRAMTEVAACAQRMILIGIDPEEPDPELGYIVPGWPVHDGGLFTVRRFIEKPPRVAAERLLAQGGVWNSFIWVAHGRALRDVIAFKYPEVVAALLCATRAAGMPSVELTALYERLQPLDFSRDVLSDVTERLLVRRVPSCGWSDLGTPRRVLAALRVAPRRVRAQLTKRFTRSLLDAAARLPEWHEEIGYLDPR